MAEDDEMKVEIKWHFPVKELRFSECDSTRPDAVPKHWQRGPERDLVCYSDGSRDKVVAVCDEYADSPFLVYEENKSHTQHMTPFEFYKIEAEETNATELRTILMMGDTYGAQGQYGPETESYKFERLDFTNNEAVVSKTYDQDEVWPLFKGYVEPPPATLFEPVSEARAQSLVSEGQKVYSAPVVVDQSVFSVGKFTFSAPPYSDFWDPIVVPEGIVGLAPKEAMTVNRVLTAPRRVCSEFFMELEYAVPLVLGGGSWIPDFGAYTHWSGHQIQCLEHGPRLDVAAHYPIWMARVLDQLLPPIAPRPRTWDDKMAWIVYRLLTRAHRLTQAEVLHKLAALTDKWQEFLLPRCMGNLDPKALIRYNMYSMDLTPAQNNVGGLCMQLNKATADWTSFPQQGIHVSRGEVRYTSMHRLLITDVDDEFNYFLTVDGSGDATGCFRYPKRLSREEDHFRFMACAAVTLAFYDCDDNGPLSGFMRVLAPNVRGEVFPRADGRISVSVATDGTVAACGGYTHVLNHISTRASCQAFASVGGGGDYHRILFRDVMRACMLTVVTGLQRGALWSDQCWICPGRSGCRHTKIRANAVCSLYACGRMSAFWGDTRCLRPNVRFPTARLLINRRSSVYCLPNEQQLEKKIDCCVCSDVACPCMYCRMHPFCDRCGSRANPDSYWRAGVNEDPEPCVCGATGSPEFRHTP